MYTLMKQASVGQLLWLQTPAFVISLVIASVFYKFGSFLLECIAFLSTWFLLDFLVVTVRDIVSRRSAEPADLPRSDRT